jgi:RHS repeat-associated protein
MAYHTVIFPGMLPQKDMRQQPGCCGFTFRMIQMNTMTLLTGSDRMNSVVWRSDAPALNYTPHGTPDADAPGDVGFHGERRDPVNGTTHLGNGYRAYSPVLMRFTCPDSLSPFGAGGINPYAYCAGDPVNRADPSGHMSTGQSVGLGLGLLAGILLGIVTGGAAMPVVAALAVDVVGGAVIGAGTELAAEGIDHQKINWGAVGVAAGIGAAMSLVGFGAAKGLSRSGEFVGDWRYKLQHAGGKPGKFSGGSPYGVKIGGGDNASIYKTHGDKSHVIKVYSTATSEDKISNESMIFNKYYGEGTSSVEFHHDSNVQMIRMKKIDGVSLNMIGEHTLPGNSLELFDVMVNNLGDKGIIHTDLSKGNILWDRKKRIFNPVDFSFEQSRTNGITDTHTFYRQDRNTIWSRDYIANRLMRN